MLIGYGEGLPVRRTVRPGPVRSVMTELIKLVSFKKKKKKKNGVFRFCGDKKFSDFKKYKKKYLFTGSRTPFFGRLTGKC